MMTKPTDPKKIVLKNEYYPNGLTAQDLYDYYSDKTTKKTIIKECNKKPVILFMSMNYQQNLVVKRKSPESDHIILDNETYDKFINGYTVSISSETFSQEKTNIIIIDVDPIGDEVSEDEIKESLTDLIDFFKLPYRITNTQTGYHIYFKSKKSFSLSQIKEVIAEKLLEKFSEKYMINYKGKSKNAAYPINFDLSPMNKRGSAVVVGALNRNGLICMDITKTYKTFQREDSKIK